MRRTEEVITVLDVWDELRAVERRLDDLFRTFTGPHGWLTFPAMPRRLRRPFLPPTDVFAREGDLVIRAELAGVDPEKDVSVTLEEGELIIRGERRQAEEIKEEDSYLAEARYGAFERRIPVPERTAEKDIEARYEDGVLEIVVKGASEIKAPEAKSIPVRSVERGTKAEAA